jgi:hypothetical protein
MTPCSLIEIYQIFGENYCLDFSVQEAEEGDIPSSEKFVNFLPVYMAPHPRKNSNHQLTFSIAEIKVCG